MSFRDIVDFCQLSALSAKLQPDEVDYWHYYCREYSKRFHEPLSKVKEMNPELVLSEVFADQLSDWDVEERFEDILDLVGSLSDPEYDMKKERAFREETRKMVEEDRQRIKEGRAVHSSLEKDKRVIVKEAPRELPKSGGLNMGLINQLNQANKENNEK